MKAEYKKDTELEEVKWPFRVFNFFFHNLSDNIKV